MELLISSLWVAHLVGMGFDFIVIAPLLPSVVASPLSLHERYLLLLLYSSTHQSVVVQQLVAILVLWQEEMSAHPSICQHKPLSLIHQREGSQVELQSHSCQKENYITAS